ncbi:hypothetical protein [Cupriavidus sp. TMH.W2]|uniref:hypothetical protein n=1 Tax=Cupriavidus sp. TMH.W2 TaxID=3434465 RepID=UPI003D785CFE
MEAVVSAAAAEKAHRALIAALKRSAGLDTVRLGNERDGFSMVLSRCLVIAEDGTPLGEYREWIEHELSAAGGNWRAVWNNHRGSGLRLSGAEITKIRLVAPYGAGPAEFFQLLVSQTQVYIERRLFSEESWGAPRDEDDLRNLEGCKGDLLDDKVPMGKASYALEGLANLVDVLQLEEDLDRERKAQMAQKVLRFKDLETGEVRETRFFDEHPELRSTKPRLARFIADWERSSAGQSGAELSRHWVFEISDYTAPNGKRHLNVIPAWTATKRLPKIAAKRGRTAFGLWDELLRFDVRAGHRFAWFFYMVHGNRLSSWVGEQILEAAEAGQIVLPESDYQVLKDWSVVPYAF